MTYVDAAEAPLANTGQIKLHGTEAFAGMRKAGRGPRTSQDSEGSSPGHTAGGSG
jgi:hypothetical protein